MFRQIKRNWNRMALIRPNEGAVCGQTEPLLVIRLHDAANHLVRKDNVLLCRVRNQRIDIRPAFRVETQADQLRLMPQHQAEEFADIHRLDFLELHQTGSDCRLPPFPPVFRKRSKIKPIRNHARFPAGAGIIDQLFCHIMYR